MLTELPDFYKSNLKLLKENHPHIWSMIENENCTPVGELFLAPNGQPNLRVRSAEGEEVILHDLDNPDNEISDALEIVPQDATGMVVLIGMGLGYMISPLLEQRPKIRHLAVFDLGVGIFMQALKVMDFTTAFSDPRLILSFDHEPNVMEVLAPADKALQLENIYRPRHLMSIKTDITAYEKLEQSVFEFISQRNIAGNTDQLFGKRFIENRLTILSSLHHHWMLESLLNCFAKIPAILVAGGPSLDKNIHLLPKLKNNAIIIAVDSVLPTLLDRGISPHFITSIDPQRLNYEKIADRAHQAENISLIAAPYVTPEIHQCFPAAEVFWTFSDKPIEKWISTMVGGKISTAGSSTAAHLNLIAAIIMGCSPIVFIGQDLAYSDYKDHASGVLLSNPKSAEKKAFDKNPNAVWLDGIDNEKVPSTRTFLSMKNHFEDLISANPGPRYINATEGGAHLAGTEVFFLQTVLDQFCTIPMDITAQFKAILEKRRRSNLRQLIKHLTSTLKSTNKLLKTVSKYDQLIHLLHKKFKKNSVIRSAHSPKELPLPTQKQINEAESLEKKMDQDDHMQIWKILEEGTMTDVKESERVLHEVKSPFGRTPEKFIFNFIQNLDRLIKLNSARKNILSLFQQKLTQIINFQQMENSLQERIYNKQNMEQNLMELTTLYFENHKYILAQRTLQYLEDIAPDHNQSTVYFYKGAIAAWQSIFELRDTCFQKAQEIDPSTKKIIQRFQKKMGDTYLELSIKSHGPGGPTHTTRKMLFKGIHHCGNHAQLMTEIDSLAKSDLKQIQSALTSNTSHSIEGLLLMWLEEFQTNENVMHCITNEMVADFYHLYGIHLFAKENLDEALKSLETALQHAPENAAVFATIAEIFFSVDDFTNGISYLNKAVAMDPSHALVWEKLGDKLQANAAFNDAITAYEQCAMVMTDNLNLLKKIGDCYRDSEQLEAAREVYKMVKEKYDERDVLNNN